MQRETDQRLTKWLGHRRLPVVVVAVAALLVAPCLWSPLVADDHVHRMRISPDHHFPGFDHDPMNLFAFGTGEPEQRQALMEEGVFPWWTPEKFKLAFWRPLSAVTHIVDHTLWSESSVLMHIQSVVWFLILLWLTALLYRRLLRPWIAGLALMLYAFDDARGMVLSFVANRNAIIAAVFAVGALLAHIRWRRDGWTAGAVLSPFLFGLGLLGGESALAMTAYLFTYQLFLDRDVFVRRLTRILPHTLVVVCWTAIYYRLGFGTNGSGIYMNPVSEPLSYASKLAERLPVLLLGQLTGPPSDLWIFYPSSVSIPVYVAALAVGATSLALVMLLLRHDPYSRFWFFGALLAVLPACATFPSDRLLVFVGFGAMGMLALLVARLLELRRSGSRPRRWVATTALSVIVFLHCIVAPLLLPVRSLTVSYLASIEENFGRGMPRDAGVRNKTLVVVSAPVDGIVAYTLLTRAVCGIPRPRVIRLLATGLHEVDVTRVDKQTIRIRPHQGFLSSEGERMVRGLSIPMRAGEQVRLSDMMVTVTEITDDGRAAEAEFRFQVPLEDPSLLWRHTARQSLVPYSPPTTGRTETLPSPL